MDLRAADVHQRLGAAQHAGRRAAHLHMGARADRLQLELRVEGRDLEGADVGHVEHVGDMLDRRLRHPAFLLLREHQKRDDGRLLAALRIFADPGLHLPRIVGAEGEGWRLDGWLLLDGGRTCAPYTFGCYVALRSNTGAQKASAGCRTHQALSTGSNSSAGRSEQVSTSPKAGAQYRFVLELEDRRRREPRRCDEWIDHSSDRGAGSDSASTEGSREILDELDSSRHGRRSTETPLRPG